MSLYCDAWNSDSKDVYGLASSLLKNRLLAQERRSCNNVFAVLCIEATSEAQRRRQREAEAGGRYRRESEVSEEYQELMDDMDSTDLELLESRGL